MDDMKRENAEAFFSEVFGGRHHIPGKLKEWGPGWAVTTHGELATYDFDALTRLVFLAHDRCVRVSIRPASPMHLRIIVHQRQREGPFCSRHPTLEQSIERLRARRAVE